MPLADDAAVRARPHSPRLVRALLLGACGAGLIGLALPSGPAATSVLAVSPAASTTILVEAVPHTPAFVPPRVTPPRATRTRAVAAKRLAPPVKKPIVRKRVVKKASARWFAPSRSAVISPYGPRDGRMHRGLDFADGYGDPIRAAGDGVVIGSGYLSGESGYGIITLVRHSNGFITAYAHQAKSFVGAGDRVAAGETIGSVGSTGHSTGPHLHFEVRTAVHGGQVNPRPWLRERGVSV